ncbi:hypothetical protein QTN25_009334 [Entamoeba marina]
MTSLETPKRNVYWTGVVGLLLKRISTEIIPKNMSEKKVHKKLITDLQSILCDVLYSTFRDIEKKQQSNYILNFFINIQNTPSANYVFALFKEYLSSMKRDHISQVIINVFIEMFVTCIDRSIFSTFGQVAAFCELLRQFSIDPFHKHFILVNALCDLTVINLQIISPQDLATTIAPTLSYKQILLVLSKVEPKLDKNLLDKMSAGFTTMINREDAKTNPYEVSQFEMSDIPLL